MDCTLGLDPVPSFTSSVILDGKLKVPESQFSLLKKKSKAVIELLRRFKNKNKNHKSNIIY